MYVIMDTVDTQLLVQVCIIQHAGWADVTSRTLVSKTEGFNQLMRDHANQLLSSRCPRRKKVFPVAIPTHFILGLAPRRPTTSPLLHR